MTGLEAAVWIVLGLLAAGTVTAVAARVADVRIAAHTGVDPRVDRDAAKQAAMRRHPSSGGKP